MDPNEFFFRLTPDRILDAVESGGFRPTGHCTALNALENRVYDVRVEDERQLVAKFYRPGRWTRAAILDEHRLLFALDDAEIPVCVPLRLADGDSLHEIEGIYFALWPRTGGRSPDELDDGEVQILGRLLARIHSVAEATTVKHRGVLDSQSYALGPLDLLERGGFLPPFCARRYRAAAEEVSVLYDEWSRGVAQQPIHGDCHFGNLLHGDRGWFFLDFDDLMVGPAVHDVWMLLPGRDLEAARQRSVLIDAYRQFRAFEETSMRLVEPLRAFRFIYYAAWIARRWEDPAFPDAFPHFGTDDYWEKETCDLEDQLQRCRQGGAPGGAIGEAVESEETEAEGRLSNKDFFWDL